VPKPPEGLAQALVLRGKLSRKHRRETPRGTPQGDLCTNTEWQSLRKHNHGATVTARVDGRRRRRGNAQERERLREQADRDDAAAAAADHAIQEGKIRRLAAEVDADEEDAVAAERLAAEAKAALERRLGGSHASRDVAKSDDHGSKSSSDSDESDSSSSSSEGYCRGNA
jgi:hypothetical protein